MCIGVYTIIKKPRVSPWFKAKPLPAKPKKKCTEIRPNVSKLGALLVLNFYHPIFAYSPAFWVIFLGRII